MINNKLYITIASDASTGKERTGLAYYIRDDSGTTKEAWAIDEKMSSNLAEMIAMVAALKVVSKREYLNKPSLIYYCDNTTALQALTKHYFTSKTGKQKYGQIGVDLMKLTTMFADVEARHVPAHTGKTELKRYFMNRWCDFNARAMMRHGRLHIKRIPLKGIK